MLGGLWALELGKAAELDKLHRYFVNEWAGCFLLDRRLVRRCKGVFLSGDGADHRVAVIAISKLGRVASNSLLLSLKQLGWAVL